MRKEKRMTEYLKREDVRRAVLHNEGDAVIAAIDELQPVEIVHCGECKYFTRLEKGHPCGTCRADRFGSYSGKWNVDVTIIRRESFFCKEGEKEETDDD